MECNGLARLGGLIKHIVLNKEQARPMLSRFSGQKRAVGFLINKNIAGNNIEEFYSITNRVVKGWSVL